MSRERDPDARAQAHLRRDPGAADAHLPPDQAARWLTPDTDPDGINPVALAVMLATVPEDDARYVAARLAIEIRQDKTALREAGHDVHAAVREHDPGLFTGRPSHADLERERSTFRGVLDRRHLALRADPDHGRARRRRAS